MKTRIISGIVLALIAAAVVALGYFVSPFFVMAVLAVLAGIAAYELIHNAAGIKNKFANFVGVTATALFVIVYNIPLRHLLINFANDIYADTGIMRKVSKLLALIAESGVYCLMIAYILAVVILIIVKHGEFDLSKIFVLLAAPRILGFAFSCVDRIIGRTNGIYYLLLMITFSCICDMGAYFIGVAAGKRKLCPEISPKKTVEGLIGGIVSAVIVAVVLMLCFGMKARMLTTCLLTIPFCLIGVCGDLFASVIKRSVGIKDYGTLIPGHGGVLDRFDSILLIAPVMVITLLTGLI